MSRTEWAIFLVRLSCLCTDCD